MSRYVVGIDLGTTNCALAYADIRDATADAPPPIRHLPLPQVAALRAVAGELTGEAARAAGLERGTLLEERQPAFGAWISAQGGQWRKRVKVGGTHRVCDVGGGTTEYALIAVPERNGHREGTREAVGA